MTSDAAGPSRADSHDRLARIRLIDSRLGWGMSQGLPRRELWPVMASGYVAAEASYTPKHDSRGDVLQIRALAR